MPASVVLGRQMNLVQNERTKHLATLVNTIAATAMGAGLLALAVF